MKAEALDPIRFTVRSMATRVELILAGGGWRKLTLVTIGLYSSYDRRESICIRLAMRLNPKHTILSQAPLMFALSRFNCGETYSHV